jgi:hypothetical protein
MNESISAPPPPPSSFDELNEEQQAAFNKFAELLVAAKLYTPSSDTDGSVTAASHEDTTLMYVTLNEALSAPSLTVFCCSIHDAIDGFFARDHTNLRML